MHEQRPEKQKKGEQAPKATGRESREERPSEYSSFYERDMISIEAKMSLRRFRREKQRKAGGHGRDCCCGITSILSTEQVHCKVEVGPRWGQIKFACLDLENLVEIRDMGNNAREGTPAASPFRATQHARKRSKRGHKVGTW